jgi:hypothetical protein
MIKITLEGRDGASVELWQDGGVHWAAGTVLDALTSETPPKRIIVDVDIDQASVPGVTPPERST